MSAELGSWLLALLLSLSAVQALLGWRASEDDLPLLLRLSLTGWALASLALGLLWHAFLSDDFSVASVAMHSHLAKPWFYKLSASWGHHEGSLLLWLWVLSAYGAGLALTGGRLRPQTHARALGIQGGLVLLIALFVTLTSSPFARLWPAPPDGGGLNPLLQDVGLAIHPPMLYLGYVGFSLTFSLASALLLQGDIRREDWRLLRGWSLIAWGFLTFGITLGAWWAHRELGWGGWWFWDPVENASLLPWLGGTALLHLLLASERRGLWRKFSLLLALVSFVLSLLGTFLVRSGLLTSVHAFANDPTRGLAILLIITLIGGFGLWIYASHAGKQAAQPLPAALSRESGLYANALLFVAALLIVLLGVGYPLVTQALWTTGVSIGPDYYDETLTPLAVIGLVLMFWLPDLSWKQGSLPLWWKQQGRSLLVSLAAALPPVLWLGNLHREKLWLFIPAFWLAIHALLRLPVQPRQMPLSTLLSHAGFALLIAGAVGSGTWQRQREAIMKPGESLELAGYRFEYADGGSGKREDYVYAAAALDVTHGKDAITRLSPERRHYPVQKQPTSEADRHLDGLTELHAVLADVDREGRISLRLYVTPLMPLVWLAGFLLGLGGLLGGVECLRKAHSREIMR